MSGHGHVTPNADGTKARCGGPGICAECSKEAAACQTPTPPEPLMQFFSYSHLPPHMQTVSAPFAALAVDIVSRCPRNPERTVALRKLLEAKDCAVRSLIYKG